MNRAATYRIVKSTPDAVWIADEDGPLSVTNDAERVVAELFKTYGDRRIIYRDIDGNWDELQHRGATFIGYAAARELAP